MADLEAPYGLGLFFLFPDHRGRICGVPTGGGMAEPEQESAGADPKGGKKDEKDSPLQSSESANMLKLYYEDKIKGE